MYNAFAEHYDRFTIDVDYKKRAEYFDKIIMSLTNTKGILLDLACGTGTLTIEMDKLGYDVMGIDASYEMLAVAREKSQIYGKDIMFVCQRMENLDLYGTVDICVCALDSINHITSYKALQKVMKLVSLFLHPDGIFIFDVNSIYKHSETLGNNCFIYEKDGIFCSWQNFTDKNNLTKINLDFFVHDKDGKYYRQTESFSEKGYTNLEIEDVLDNAGLKTLAIYGDDSFLPPKEKAQRWVYITSHKNFQPK